MLTLFFSFLFFPSQKKSRWIDDRRGGAGGRNQTVGGKKGVEGLCGRVPVLGMEEGGGKGGGGGEEI